MRPGTGHSTCQLPGQAPANFLDLLLAGGSSSDHTPGESRGSSLLWELSNIAAPSWPRRRQMTHLAWLAMIQVPAFPRSWAVGVGPRHGRSLGNPLLAVQPPSGHSGKAGIQVVRQVNGAGQHGQGMLLQHEEWLAAKPPGCLCKLPGPCPQTREPHQAWGQGDLGRVRAPGCYFSLSLPKEELCTPLANPGCCSGLEKL